MDRLCVMQIFPVLPIQHAYNWICQPHKLRAACLHINACQGGMHLACQGGMIDRACLPCRHGRHMGLLSLPLTFGRTGAGDLHTAQWLQLLKAAQQVGRVGAGRQRQLLQRPARQRGRRAHQARLACRRPRNTL